MVEFIININGRKFDIDSISETEIKIDREDCHLDIINLDKNQYSVIFNNQVFEFIIEQDSPTHYRVDFNNESHNLTIDDERDLLFNKFKSREKISNRLLEVKAPMPGLVLRVEVQVGQKVKIGTGLVILEAMKMENEIRSLTDGTVKEIKVIEKSVIDKGETLIILE
jgi:biotin carboxyl carrier protein